MPAANYETKFDEALFCAKQAADKYKLPQTVFRNNDTCGWWHTNPFASTLLKSEVQVSVLPVNYFQ